MPVKSKTLFCEQFGFKFLLHTYLWPKQFKWSVLKNIFRRIFSVPEFVLLSRFRKKLYFSCTLSTVWYIFSQEKSSYSILFVFKQFQFAQFVLQYLTEKYRTRSPEWPSPFSIFAYIHTIYSDKRLLVIFLQKRKCLICIEWTITSKLSNEISLHA